MRLALLLSYAFAAGAAASRGPGHTRVRRQKGPVDPGTAPDCTFWETALDSSFTCSYFEESYGITHADFVDWNPGVKADCSGIKIGNAYCVEVNFGLPRPTTRPTPTPTTTKPPGGTTTTDPGKPSPTQDGLISTCTKFYRAVSGDTCDGIASKHGNTFTFADFLRWNPAVGSACSGLWADYWYCVAVPGTGTTSGPGPTTTTRPTGPTPTQDGIAADCQRYHLAVSGDSCQRIVDLYGTFSLADFYRWNPAVGDTCSGLWAGYYYCIGVKGTPTARPTTTTTTKPPQETCNPSAPTPTQPVAVCGCKRWHKVASGNTCDSLARQYGTTIANIIKWNPNVGSDCRGMWLDYYVCVGV